VPYQRSHGRAADGDASEIAWIPLVSNATPVPAAGKICTCKHAPALADVKGGKGWCGQPGWLRFSLPGRIGSMPVWEACKANFPSYVFQELARVWIAG
jgi:hypothetical protein